MTDARVPVDKRGAEGITVPENLRALHDATWAAVAERRDKVTGCAIGIPDEITAEAMVNESRFSTEFPVLHYLDQALDLARKGPLAHLADVFSKVLPDLRWSQNPNYTECNCTREFLDGYAYAAFSGPQGPIHVDAPRGGFILMGPGVTYPDHQHEAREVYLALTGDVSWRLDNGDWFDVLAGDLIYHDRMQPHAMRSGESPFLAFAGWVEPGERRSISFNS